MLHDAQHAHSSPCLPAEPWRRFPFPGFYETKHRDEAACVKAAVAAALAAASSASTSDEDITVLTVVEDERKGPLLQTHCHGHSHGYGHSRSHGHELVQAEGREGDESEHVRSVLVSQVVV
ncbi:zinc transporter protein ZIP7 [Panicum miliaceum]|uniref:Zinc transporter protein ZIP7 n=1 Tax=Panicum miliaceum TaxID=4540 RepID=A0A3L6TQ58_PANMI|nr:zinc transporter protein ZIP7 [Panicum miliaceum]